MNEVWNPHDRLFKEIWSDREAAVDFVSRYLPEGVRRLIDPETVEMCKDSFVSADLREYFSDLLYRVSIEGRAGYLYLLLEHKSFPSSLLPFQLLGYMKGIWDLHLKQADLPLPVVIPLVLYHGRDPWHVEGSLSGLLSSKNPKLQQYVPDFRYHLIDLSRYADEDIKGHVLVRVGMLLLKHVFRADYRERIPESLKLMRELIEKKTGMQYIETVLRYIFHTVEGMDVEDLKPVVERNLSKDTGEWMMTLAEKIKSEGVRQGIQQGMQQGMQQGIRQGLLEGITALIELKFGEPGLRLLPEISRIDDTERLRQIKDAIRVSPDLKDLEKVIYH